MPGGNECLLNNAISEDLQKALRPFNLVTELLLMSKFRIKDNFITPCSRKYYILSLGILVVFLYSYKDIIYWIPYRRCSMIAYTLYPVIYAILTANAVYHSMSAVELVTNMQKINKKLRATGASNLLHHSRKNWCYIVCILLAHGLEALLVIAEFNILSAYTKFLSSVILDLEMLYATFVIDFLSSRMNAWVMVLMNSNARLADTDSNECTIMPLIFGTMKDIFRTFRIHKTLCQCVVVIHTISIFTQGLLGVEILILQSKKKVLHLYPSVSSIIILIVNLSPLIYLIMLSTTCERFDCGVGRVKKACVDTLDDPNCTKVSTRRLSKNVLRLCGTHYSKMRACGLFTVDAALPLRLLRLLTTYCIVLLQFELL